MKHGSLFSGIGGFDLAAEWMGWENVFHCEWNPFGQKVLKYYWPKAISYADITKTDFSIHRGGIDILTGGFPCQPFSTAGKRKGKEDDRYLWPEMLRTINEIRPRWICGENVAGLVSMVQPEVEEISVESQASILEEDDQKVITEMQEYVIETICNDLERIGYSVQPIIIPACATGAPHRRDRIWFIAFDTQCKSDGRNDSGKSINTWLDLGGNELEKAGRKQGSNNSESSSSNGTIADTCCNGYERGRLGEDRCEEGEGESVRDQWQRIRSDFGGISEPGDVTNTEYIRFQGGQSKTHKGLRTPIGRSYPQQNWRRWENFPTQSPICNGNDGLSGTLDGITFSKWRAESIKAGGNAIVPQVAYQIFQAIAEYESLQQAS